MKIYDPKEKVESVRVQLFVSQPTRKDVKQKPAGFNVRDTTVEELREFLMNCINTAQ